jgi:hypothetical protein
MRSALNFQFSPTFSSENISVILFGMFLHPHGSKKDGEGHRYSAWWKIGECHRARRCSGLLCILGEINDPQQTAWLKTLNVFDEQEQKSRELSLFPDDREIATPN